MEIFVDLLILTCLCVFVIDYSGFIGEMEQMATRWFKSPLPLRIPKPFSCSLCSSFWTGLIYLAVTGNFTLPWIGVVAALAASTKLIYSGMVTILGALERMVWMVASIFKL